jgi:hypothetical protein
VVEPEAFVAFSVYVVVVFGFTLVEPVAEVDLKVPGVMAIRVAPFVAQLSLLLAPKLMTVGAATNETILGEEAGRDKEVGGVAELQ